MFKFPEMKDFPKTAVEVVEKSRELVTKYVTLIPEQNTQAFVANVYGAQFGVATVIAEQLDKSIAQMKTTLGVK